MDPDAEVVRKCWICEVEVYTAKGKGKEEVLGDGERVLVDTDSEVVRRLSSYVSGLCRVYTPGRSVRAWAISRIQVRHEG